MYRPSYNIVHKAGNHIARLFIKQLPKELLFHNFHHTINVIRGVIHISNKMAVTQNEKEILMLAAWFHDSGHIHAYQGHEAYSQQLAEEFLVQEQYPHEHIQQVLNCIAATTMPQQPADLLQEIICDADLFHLSLPGYFFLQKMLREEWKQVCGKVYTDEEWYTLNLRFFREHEYHTAYGKETLSKKKALIKTRYEQTAMIHNS